MASVPALNTAWLLWVQLASAPVPSDAAFQFAAPAVFQAPVGVTLAPAVTPFKSQ